MLAPGGRPAERNPRVHGLAERLRLRRVASGAQARREWERAVLDRPDLAVTQLPAWLDCMVGAGYHDATRLYESADGRRLVLPLARRGQLPGLGMSASWPMYWEGGLDNGGLLSPTVPVTAASPNSRRTSPQPGLRTTVTPSVGEAPLAAASPTTAETRRHDVSVDLEALRRLVGGVSKTSGTRPYAERHGVQVGPTTPGGCFGVSGCTTPPCGLAQESARVRLPRG